NIADGQWHHVAAVFDNTLSQDVKDVKLYVDGQLDTISSFLPRLIDTAVGNKVKIGTFTGGSSFFNGLIDDVRIYDRALSANEVRVLLNDPKQRHTHYNYAAMLKTIDDNVGKIRGKLKEKGIDDNTVVIFLSDNGGLGGMDRTPPLRGFKGTHYEGGIRVPMIVSWPGHIPAHSTCDVPVTSCDLMPTLLDIGGVNVSPSDFDGVSLRPLLENPAGHFVRPGYDSSADSNAIYWHLPSLVKPHSAVRKGKWKLLKTLSTNRQYEWNDDFDHNRFQLKYDIGSEVTYELYNLEKDLAEKNNLYRTETEMANNLKNLLHGWLEHVDAEMPRPLAIYYGTVVEMENDTGGRIATSLTNALNQVRKNGAIILTPGVHRIGPSGIFINKDITITSIDPDNPEIVRETVIQAARENSISNESAVISFDSMVTNVCRLEGLTISGIFIPNAGENQKKFNGIDGNGATPTFVNCIIRGHHRQSGGVIRDCDGDFINCAITHNSASNGAILVDCDGRFINCVITENVSAAANGSTIKNCEAEFTNCTVAGNINSGHNATLVNNDTETTSVIYNCIFWNNLPDNSFTYDGIVRYSNIGGSGGSDNWIPKFGLDGGGNIDSDPLFANVFDDWDMTASNNINANIAFDTIKVNDSSKFSEDNFIKIDFDGVARDIVEVDHLNSLIKFRPPVSPAFKDPDHMVTIWSGVILNVEFDVPLLDGSPSIDTGDPTGSYSDQVDIDGEPRVYNGIIDMGADERHAAF
ncbi:MAG: sulfatase-like hydrolase/transferase, partial [Planctomycetes bacterium]|nr:sulfatase-like hydrolase/transferase [Planctomycetota bacterium]